MKPDRNRHHNWLILSALCLIASGCEVNQTDHLSKQDNRVTTAVPQRDKADSGIPGLDVVPLLDGLKLRDTIEKCVESGQSHILVINNTAGFGYDMKDALAPLTTPEAIKRVRQLELLSFPIDDEMLEQINGLRLVDLTIKSAELVNLHAIKSMTSLQKVNVSKNPLNTQAAIVLSHLPNLSYLDINHTPLSEDDLKLIMKNTKIVHVRLESCPKISDAAIARFRLVYRRCEFEVIPVTPAPTLSKRIMTE